MDEKHDIAVHFNNEYIGQAESFTLEKGNDEQMPLLKIKGDYQAGEDDE